MGEHTEDPGAVKAKDTVKTMEYSLQHLIDQMQYINRQQNFQRVACENCDKDYNSIWPYHCYS